MHLIFFQKNDSGFTLIEVMIVIVIMGVMAAIAAPNFFSLLDTIRVTGAAKNLAAEMMLAKFRAISENNQYIVTFDPSGNSYSVYDDNNGNSNGDTGELVKTVNITSDYPNVQYGYVPGTNNTNGAPITEADAVTFASNKVTFKPDGTPQGGLSGSGAIYMILSKDLAAGKRDRMRAITVAQTGRIKFWRYKGSPASSPWE